MALLAWRLWVIFLFGGNIMLLLFDGGTCWRTPGLVAPGVWKGGGILL